MVYKKIMNVGLTIKDEKRGCIIIGGVDNKFPLYSLDITGKNIIVKSSTNELNFKVKKVDIPTSIAGKINVGIVLFDSAEFNKVVSGDEVLKDL
ncbi:hypothetical protein [Clostridium felsineum]|uniref:hypothetical protein n=1 Tax=Clostridium felsineum TaxID=36839 RepID=UPI00098CCCFC|nr:hypothetical protein [Clostridium felsineum]URZ02567.1 hypothetical protein CLAUR_025790 [Clostridium felsineum]URZ18352.1 hypothetical protein CLFE_044220 [Clostridium felsineum DSM 794]